MSFHLIGPPNTIVLPEPPITAVRQDGLWRSTCFELFLGPGGETNYWEYNLVSNGCWNVYRFEDYRSGIKAEPAVSPPVFCVSSGAAGIALHGQCPLPEELSGMKKIRIGLSCVLEHQSGTISYWALNHPCEKPDFHHGQSFVLEV